MPEPSEAFANLRRFFCASLPHPRLSERLATLDPEETRHAKKVLRLRPGDAVELFDGQGSVARATIERYESGLAHCRVAGVTQAEPPKPWITIAASIPKGPRADEMVNLLSQFGCDRLVPLMATRSEVDPRQAKLDKFGRAAVESAKQSHRVFVMQVDRSRTFAEALQDAADVKLIATIGDFPVRDLAAKLRAARSVLVLIGPVGDWTDDEVAAAREAGFSSWSLGPNVLRVEAAASAAAAVLRYLATERSDGAA